MSRKNDCNLKKESMKTKIFKPVSYVLILSLGLMFAFNSCEKAPDAMELPPAESLVINLDAFPSSTTKALGPESAWNFAHAGLSVLFWNTAVVLNIAIPTVAYAAAFNHDPVYLGDNSWEWSYSVPVNGKTVVARLVGTRIDNETFSMEMTLSENGGFQDFKWFEGVIRYDHTAANWTLAHSPDNGVDYLDIAYTKDFETDVANIRYTVIDPQNELYNDYIDYGINPEFDFDAHYTISRADTTTMIEWNTTTDAGRVKDERRFGDTEWHCWDTQLQDVDCASSQQSLE